MNRWIWEEPLISNKYPTFSPFMEMNDKIFLIKKNINGFMNSLPVSLSDNLLRVFHRDYNYTYSPKVGGYAYLERDKVDSLLAHCDLNKMYEGYKLNQYKISNAHIHALEKMVDYCNNHHIKLYLVRCPLPSFFPIYGNEKVFQDILRTKFNKVEFLDFSRFSLKNNEFGDLEHVNYRGAKKFSMFFDKMIKKGLLENNNKQEFINSNMNELNDTLNKW